MLVSTCGLGTTGHYLVPYMLISTCGRGNAEDYTYMPILILNGGLRGTTGDYGGLQGSLHVDFNFLGGGLLDPC